MQTLNDLINDFEGPHKSLIKASIGFTNAMKGFEGSMKYLKGLIKVLFKACLKPQTFIKPHKSL